jgi:hypothetical protein
MLESLASLLRILQRFPQHDNKLKPVEALPATIQYEA